MSAGESGTGLGPKTAPISGSALVLDMLSGDGRATF